MTEQEFNQLAQQGYNRILLTLETLADLDTPLSLYLKLANALGLSPEARVRLDLMQIAGQSLLATLKAELDGVVVDG